MKYNLFLILFSVCSMFTLTAQTKDVTSTDDYVLMPYRAGDKWGLCDTLGTVKVKPEYDAFVDMIVDKPAKKSIYYMKQKGRIIAIDHKNTEYLTEYDSINPVTSRLYKNGKTGLYEYKYANPFNKTPGNFAILAEPVYDEIEKLESSAYIIKINGKQGLLYVKEGHEIIPLKPEYDTIIFQKPYFKGYKGSVATGSFKDPIYDYSHDSAIAPAGTSAEEKKRSDVARQKQEEAERKTVIENLKRNASPEDLEHILPIELSRRNKYVVKYRDGKKYGQVLFSMNIDEKTKHLTKRIVFPPVYDSILEMHTFNYLIKQDGKYGFRRAGNTILEPQYDDIKFPSIHSDYLLLKKGNKYAIYIINEGTLTGFEYDAFTFIPASEYEQYAILQKGKKKQLRINSNTSQEFDELIPIYRTKAQVTMKEPSYFKCKIDGKWGIVSIYGKISVPPEYDDVLSEEPGFYTTIIKGKRGGYLDEAPLKINIPPQYKSVQLFKIIEVGKRRLYLFRVEDKKDVFFYTDGQGREFYKS